MDLTFTDEQDLLRQTVRELCAKHSPPEAVRALEDDAKGYSEDLWRELCALGLTGLAIPEEHGGTGGTMLDLVVVYEELGRALASTPHLVSAVAAARALLAAGHTALLPAIASGDALVTVAWHEPGRDVAMTADGGTLSGEKIMVPFASSATHILTVARDGLYLVAPEAVRLEQERTMASDAAYRVIFDRAPAERVGDAFDADDALVAVAAFCVGGAARAHEMAVSYAKERIQFDHPIGSYQGVAHPLADMATEIGGSKVLTYQAAWARDAGVADRARTLAAMAKLYAADVFKRTTKVGQQVYGGIGFTLEIDMQLYFRRAKQLEITWVGARALEERIAAAELDADDPFVSLDAS